jgi:hypothetical protein
MFLTMLFENAFRLQRQFTLFQRKATHDILTNAKLPHPHSTFLAETDLYPDQS